ncbi:MAG TPA: hypothetical protein VMA72_02195 [Streptosporangiaceae bacterium]|nr:hypothetical protein [Streptosporangiaceae bacterium]
MNDKRDRAPLGHQNLASAGGDQEPAPERASTSPDSEGTPGVAERFRQCLLEGAAASWRLAVPRRMTLGHAAIWQQRAAYRQLATSGRAGHRSAAAFRRARFRWPAPVRQPVGLLRAWRDRPAFG